jgi:hypothetical protein
MDFSSETPYQSADRRDCKLLADLSGQAIVDFCVARNQCFRACGRIGVSRVRAAFPIQAAPLALVVSD